MPKYLITVADIDLNINTDQPKETVDALVETVSERMRDIAAKDPRLSKSEAAIFCALDDCAEKIRCQKEAADLNMKLAELTAEYETLKADYAALSEEAEEVRRQNRVLENLITKSLNKAALANAVSHAELTLSAGGEQLVIDTTDNSTPTAADVMFDGENEGGDATPNSEAAPVKKQCRATRVKASNAKNKVGDMFGMLTFKDV